MQRTTWEVFKRLSWLYLGFYCSKLARFKQVIFTELKNFPLIHAPKRQTKLYDCCLNILNKIERHGASWLMNFPSALVLPASEKMSEYRYIRETTDKIINSQCDRIACKCERFWVKVIWIHRGIQYKMTNW